jgi:hypothetical protein
MERAESRGQRFREINPYVGVDPTPVEIEANLEDDIAMLKAAGDHDKAREFEDALRSRREARGLS